MENITAENSPWAHFSKLDATESLSMTASKEILMHCEVHEKAMNWERSSWLSITSMINYICKTVNLCQKTSIN